MNLHHNISSFIDRPDIPVDVGRLDRIVKFHMIPLNHIHQSVPLRVHSCYRPKEHELEKGRSGNSLHTFSTDRDPKGRGACDVSASDMRGLVALIESHIKPSRIALYSTFIHYDYCNEDGNVKYYNSSWEKIGRTKFWEML